MVPVVEKLERVGQLQVTVEGQDGKLAGAVLEKESLMVGWELNTMPCVAAAVLRADTFGLLSTDMFEGEQFEFAGCEDDKLAKLDAELVG